MKKQEQQKNINMVKTSNLILATTSYFGEGVDFPNLDTIILATPISYYGRLVQYLGRIGRSGTNSLAIDIFDNKNPFTKSAFRKRKEGYKQLHYKV
jgi:superfamily II DNA or RNA helicase